MRFFLSLLVLCLVSANLLARDVEEQFKAIYQQELGSIKACSSEQEKTIRVCSDSLKNEGNAPYVLYHGQTTDKVFVLLHGLSDSPYYFRSIAESLYTKGANVVVALLPGHGKKDADADMTDASLKMRWDKHAKDLMEFAKILGNQRYLAGFSTGGTIAAHYVLTHPNQADGLLLFSGAFELPSNVETMAKIWGIKWLAKWMEGEYDEMGANPYKYSKVHGHSGLILMDEIFAVRELIESGQELNTPLFIAHSEADDTTLIGGVEWLAQQNQASTNKYILSAELDVCHADLVINEAQISDMNFDASKLEDPTKKCWVPQANPKHSEMLAAMHEFVTAN